MFYNAKQTHQIIHKYTQYALETSDQQIGQKTNLVEIGPVNPNNKRQLWLLEGNKGGGSFEIINGFTDHVLTEDGSNFVLKKGKGNKHQTWKFDFVSDNEFIIRLAKSQNKFVGLKDGQLRLIDGGSGTPADVWVLKPVLDNTSLNKTCFIISKDSLKLIDIPESSRDEDEDLIIYDPNYRYNQRWNIYKAGEIYVIKSYFNEMNIVVQDDEVKEGCKIVQRTSHGKVNQFWHFQLMSQNAPVYRIYTCFDQNLELGHHHDKLILYKGRKFLWTIEGYFPQ